MPSDRVRKNRSKRSSTDRRRDRATYRSILAVEMVRCSRCKTKNLPDCRVPEGDDTCTNCSSVNSASCDSFGYDESAVQRVVARKRQLDKEQKEADQALGAALAKVDRLRRQRQALETEVLRMFNQEGEVLQEQERREASVVPSPAPVDPLRYMPILLPCRALPTSILVPSSALLPISTGLCWVRVLLRPVRVLSMELLQLLRAVEVRSWLP